MLMLSSFSSCHQELLITTMIWHHVTVTSLKYRVGKGEIADVLVLKQMEKNLEKRELENNVGFFF